MKGRHDECEVNILYLGDLDPSGKDIPRFMSEEALDHFGLDCDFDEIALNIEQVRENNLPEVPDAPEVRAKIGRDPRYKTYVFQYGQVFCELDAFFALATEAAQALIRSAVEVLFDSQKQEEAEARAKEAREIIHRRVRELVEFKEG